MKRILLLVLALAMCSFLYAEDTDPVPYSPDEFPPWLRDIRRAEIILLGSIPVSLILSGLIYPFYRWAINDFGSEYAPGLFSSQATRELDQDEKLGVLTVTVGISGLIALADFIIGKIPPAEK